MKAIDKLINKIKETNNPTVMGLDPRYDMLPNCVKEKYGTSLEEVCKAIIEYNKELIDNTYDIIPAIKPQIAFYEMFGIPGMQAFKETCDYAREKGMVVIADIKRGDIGSTAAGYSNAFLGKTPIGEKEEYIYDVDFVTINAYMGTDCVKPFIEDCRKYDKGIFILVKTSNPSSGELQDLKLNNNKEVYAQVAELVEKWGEDLIGANGYSSVAAVVGATYPKMGEVLRKIMPKSYILVPGYGAQGGQAKDLAPFFNEDGLGAIVNSSRGIIAAYKQEAYAKFGPENFGDASRAAVEAMVADISGALAAAK